MITALSMLNDEEQSKFQQIYSLYRKFIYLTAKKTLKDEHRTADCTQRSYEIILRNISKIGEVDSKQTKSYVYRITYCAALHIIRDERRYVPETEYEENNSIEEIEDKEGNIEHIIVNSEWRNILNAAIESLSEDEKVLLGCRAYDEMSYAEISDILGITEAACRKRIQRIRKKIADSVSK